MNSTRVILALAAFAAVPTLHAGDRFVTSGADYDTHDPIIPKTLRGELEMAQSGDTIHIARNLIVNLYDRLVIPAGKDNLTITGPEEGPAQIRAIIERGEGSQNNAIFVQGDNATFRKLSFRDISIVFGDVNPSIFVVEGGTVRDCSFVLRSSLVFAHMNDGVAERCTLKVAKYEIGAGAVDVVGGDGAQVRECEITLLGSHNGSEEALSANGGTNVRFEDNVLINGDLAFHPKSGQAIDNTLKNRVLDFALPDATPISGPGPYEVVGNECGALVVRARNFIVRENIMSGRVTGRPPPGVQAAEGDSGSEVPFALSVGVIDGPAVEIYDNVVNGGSNGVAIDVGASAAGAIFTSNEIRNVKKQGMLVVANAPVEISHNTFEKCGNTKNVSFGPYPHAALHLRTINATTTVKENDFLSCRGAAIFAAKGSPIFDTNRITRGNAAGMMFYGAVTPVFMGVNRIERMGRGGVVAKVGANITVEGVVFDQNGICGLSVEPGATVTARGNTFTGQSGPGIKLATEFKAPAGTFIARARVDGGTFTANKGAGVLVGKGGSCEIVGGQFTDNVGAGIDIVPAGVTKNTKPKLANGDIDFPEHLTFDEATRTLRGKAEPGTLVRMYRVEKNKRRGNPKNGEGALFIGSTTATGAGDFALPPGPTQEGDLFTFTATRPAAGSVAAVTSEFSDNIAVPPSPPVERISQSSNEEAGNDRSYVNEWNSGPLRTLMANTSVSTDARFVLFHSIATNLVNDDTNNTGDLFLRDRATGTIERANVASSGAQAGPAFGNFPSRTGHGSISGDGRWVVFASDAANFVADDGNSATDIFLRDRQSGTTIAVTDPSEQPDMTRRAGGFDCSISTDGNVIAFVTNEGRFTNVGPGSEHVLVWTRSTGQFEEVSVTQPVGTAAFFRCPRLSADGRFVVFETTAKLVAADDDSASDVYLRDRTNGTTERVSIATNSTPVGGATASISGDGRFVAFVTSIAADAADTNGQADIYVRDRQLSTLTWASRPPAGGFPAPNLNRGCKFPSLSADGRYLAFQASGNSARADSLTVLVEDIFVRDLQLGVTIEASIGVAGDARGDSEFPVLSPDGRQIIFESEGPGFIPGDVQPLSEVFARTLTSKDFAAP